jgi:hypothetical protein
MGGGHGQSWSSINGGMGAHRRREGEEGQGGRLGEVAARGEAPMEGVCKGEAPWLKLSVRGVLFLREAEEQREEEEREKKRKEGKEKKRKKKKIWKIFQT